MVTPTDSSRYLNRGIAATVSSFDKDSVKNGMKSPRSRSGGQLFPRDESNGNGATVVSPSSLAARKSQQWNVKRDIPAGAVRNNPFAIKESSSPRKRIVPHTPASPTKTSGGSRARPASFSSVTRDASSKHETERGVPDTPSRTSTLSPRGQSPKSGSSPWQQHAKSFSVKAELRSKQQQQQPSQPTYSKNEKTEGNRSKRWQPSQEIPNGTVKGRVSTLFGQAKSSGLKPKESTKPVARNQKNVSTNVSNRNISSKGNGAVEGVDNDEDQWIITERNKANTQVSASQWGEAVVAAKSAESDDWETPGKEWIRSGDSQTESSISNRVTRTSGNQKSTLRNSVVETNEAEKDLSLQDAESPGGHRSSESGGWEVPAKEWIHSGKSQLTSSSSLSKRATKAPVKHETVFQTKIVPKTDGTKKDNSGQVTSEKNEFLSRGKNALSPPPKGVNADHHTHVRPSAETSSKGANNAHSFQSNDFASDFKMDSMDDSEFATPFPTEDKNKRFQPSDANADVFGFPLASANNPVERQNIGEIVGGEEFFDASLSIGSDRPVSEVQKFKFDRPHSLSTHETNKNESDDTDGDFGFNPDRDDPKKKRKGFFKGLFGRKGKDKDNVRITESTRDEKKLHTYSPRSFSKSSPSDSMVSPSEMGSETSIHSKSPDVQSMDQNREQPGSLLTSKRQFGGSSQKLRVATAPAESPIDKINTRDIETRHGESKRYASTNETSRSNLFLNNKNLSTASAPKNYGSKRSAIPSDFSHGSKPSQGSIKSSKFDRDDVFVNLESDIPVSSVAVGTIDEKYIDPELDHLDMDINSDDESNSLVEKPSKTNVLKTPTTTQPKQNPLKPTFNKVDEVVKPQKSSRKVSPTQNVLVETKKNFEKADVGDGEGNEKTSTKTAVKFRKNMKPLTSKPATHRDELDANGARQDQSRIINPGQTAVRTDEKLSGNDANKNISYQTRIRGVSPVRVVTEEKSGPMGSTVEKKNTSNLPGRIRWRGTSVGGKDPQKAQARQADQTRPNFSTVHDVKTAKISTGQSSKYESKDINGKGKKSRFSDGLVIPQKKTVPVESKTLASHSRKPVFSSRINPMHSQNKQKGSKVSSNVESSNGLKSNSVLHKEENNLGYKARQHGGGYTRFPRSSLHSQNSKEVSDRVSNLKSSETDGKNKKVFVKASNAYRSISKKSSSEDSDDRRRYFSIVASTSASDISCSSSTYDNYQKKLTDSLRRANIVTQNSFEYSLHSHKSLDDSSIESDIRVLRSLLRRPRLDQDNEAVITASRQVKGFPTYDMDSATDPMQRVGLRLLSSAIVPIQTEVRRFLAMRRALTRMWALIVIQTYTREFLARTKYQRVQYSVVKLQSVVRGHLARNDIIDKHVCAIEIQRFVRGYLATMEVYEEIYKVTLVQSLVRMKIAMDDAAYRMSLIIQLQAVARGFLVRRQRARFDKAATVIQSSWRCFYNRLTYQFDLLDIIIIQSLWRRKLGFRMAAKVAKQKRDAAATVIQAKWRGYDCKMEFLCYLSARRIQTKWRLYNCRVKYIDYQASTLIQSAARRFLCRSRYVDYQASTAIQSAVRMYFCRIDYIDYVCAKKIQSIVRMFLCRSQYIEYQCASKIQSMGRMYLCRSDYLEYRAARAIQSIGRMHLCRSDYLEYRAARAIQSIGRMYVCRTYYVEYCAAQAIQSIGRMYLCRNDYVDYQAAKTVQAIARMYLCRCDYVEYQAAKAIQSIGRMYLCRYDYVEYKAARAIQSIGRMYLCRGDYVEYRAARVIQTSARMHFCRSHYVEYQAAKAIQSATRMYLCYSHYKEYQAAKAIQSIGRMYLCRYDYVEYVAARAIQAIGRMYLCRSDYVEYVAARKIQTVFRRFFCRSGYLQYRSATIIQAAWRCHDCRMDYLFYISSRKIQSIGRMFVCRTRYNDYRAATRIQSFVRMSMIRSEYVDYQAATRIQSVVRMFLCRSQYLFDRDFMAARLIQTSWRGQFHRKRYVRFTSSKLIQKQWRAYVCRKIYIENFAATIIQAKWRSYDCSSMYKRYCSARIIQKTWRSYDCQMNFLHFLADILIVQSTIRRFLVQRRVEAMKNRAATTIQREYRRYACLTSYQQTLAAIAIQRTWRGFVCFADYEEFKAARKVQTTWRKHAQYQKYTRYIAARKVQSVWRTHINHQKYKMYIATRKVQTAWRRHTYYQKYKMYVAARKVQATWRSHTHHQQYTRYIAARKVQTIWRAQFACKKYIRFVAARKIQAAWRGFVDYADYQEFLTVRKIQTAWRAYRQYNIYQRHKASVKIQAAFRCKLCHSDYRRYVAARKIQSAWRGLIRYIDYHEYLTVRKIQTLWRGYVCRRNYEREKSAIIIQSAWRGFLIYADYMFELSDIVVVQKEIRGWLARREIKKRRNHRDFNAATKIQKEWRRWVDWKMTRERDACTIIQKNWRRFWCFSNFIIALDCSIQIQAQMRGYIQNRKYSAQKLAAVAIQSTWRTANAKKVLSHLSVVRKVVRGACELAEKESSAATKIQRVFRGSLCRTALKVHLAAVLLQSRVRGNQARTAVRLYIAVRKIQASWRAFTPRRSYETYRAARKIQANWRRYIPRQGFINYIAARRIQNYWRSVKAKQMLTSLQHTFHAASLIQSAWRGFVCYTDFVFTLSDIVAAQKIVRGYLSRKKYSSVIRSNIEIKKNRFIAAIAIQRIYRGFQARQSYWYTLGCTMQIQSWWRGRHVYRMVQEKLDALLTLQCFARCSRARQEYMQRRFVFMLIQTAELERTKKIEALRIKEQMRDDMEEDQKEEAARVIQRFFVGVKDEGDEIVLATKRRKKWRKNMKRERHAGDVEEAFLEDVWLGLIAQNNFEEEPFTRNYAHFGAGRVDEGNCSFSEQKIADDDTSELSLFGGATAPLAFTRHPNSSIQLIRKLDAIEMDDDFQLEEAFIDAEIHNAKKLRHVAGTNIGRKEYGSSTISSSKRVVKILSESRNEKNKREGASSIKQ